MGEDQAAREHGLLNRLTAIKVVNRLTAIQLANEILYREGGLTDRQRRLVRTALQAADGLTADLLSDLGPIERETAPTRLHPRPQDTREERRA